MSKFGVFKAGLRRPVSANPQSSTNTNTMFGFGDCEEAIPNMTIKNKAPIILKRSQFDQQLQNIKL